MNLFEDLSSNHTSMDFTLNKPKMETPKSQATGPASRKLSFDDDFSSETPNFESSSKSFANLFLSKEKKYQSDSCVLQLNTKPSQRFEFGDDNSFRKNQQRVYLNCCSNMNKEPQRDIDLSITKSGSSLSFQASTDISETKDSLNEAKKDISYLLGKLSLANHNVIDGRAHGSRSEPSNIIKFNHGKQASPPFSLESELGKSLSLSLNKNNRDPDLNTISLQTMAKILREDQPNEYLIVDCRYPYEYQGGHIQGAINVLSPEDLEKIFFTNKDLLGNPKYMSDLKKDAQSALANAEIYRNAAVEEGSVEGQPPLIIFHCEFSQKRGPRAFRALRSKDRSLNVWPKLEFPEIYVLEGGYCNFYEQFPELCDGDYIEMTHQKYRIEYSDAKKASKLFWGKRDVAGVDLAE